jgi:DNA replication protein DnaC
MSIIEDRDPSTHLNILTTRDHSLIRKLKLYTEPTLLIVMNSATLLLDQQTSNLFYQVISTRHSHRRSTLITTNTAFSDWSNILYNHRHRGPSGGKLRNLLTRRRQPAQGRQESASAGRSQSRLRRCAAL